MMTLDNFTELADQLQRDNHLSPDDAAHYAALIGDTPEVDDSGKVIVRDEDGKELARVICT